MRNKLTKNKVLEINRKLGVNFGTSFGLGGNASNLDYALSLNDPYKIAKEILRGHPFIDGNKRTSLMVYLMLTTNKTYSQIIKDFYDTFLSLSTTN